MTRRAKRPRAKGFSNLRQEIPVILNPWGVGRPWSDGDGIGIIHDLRRFSYRARRKFLNSQSYPRFLYKFKAADERFIPHLEDIVIHSRLYLSSPRQFNDPFDMAAEIEAVGSLDDLLRGIDDSPAVPESDKQLKKDEAREIVALRGVQGYWMRYNSPLRFRETLDQTGVFSFSTAQAGERSSGPRNVLMWSHYGGSHSGVCLQFEIAREPVFLRELVRVHYDHGFPRLNWLSSSFADDLGKALWSKDVCWSYEHEWRFLLQECANTYLPISPHALTSIIVGCKMDRSKFRSIEKMLSKREAGGMPTVKLMKTVLSRHKYELRVERIH